MSAHGELVLRVVREGLLLVLVLSGPPLLASLLVGFLLGRLPGRDADPGPDAGVRAQAGGGDADADRDRPAAGRAAGSLHAGDLRRGRRVSLTREHGGGFDCRRRHGAGARAGARARRRAQRPDRAAGAGVRRSRAAASVARRHRSPAGVVQLASPDVGRGGCRCCVPRARPPGSCSPRARRWSAPRSGWSCRSSSAPPRRPGASSTSCAAPASRKSSRPIAAHVRARRARSISCWRR